VNEEFALIVSKIQDEANNVANLLSTGRVESHEEYKRLCGVIQGYARASEIVEELAKTLETADD